MLLQTATCQKQINALLEFYESKSRIRAADIRIVTNVLFETSDMPNLIAEIDQIIDTEW